MKTRIYLLGAMLLLPVMAFSQSRTITGKVTGATDSLPIPGVSVTHKGTTTGSVTDGSGTYSITVPDNKTILVFSFIGYKTQEVPMGISNVINVTLEVDAMALDEVVVVGYGVETSKRELSYSVAETRRGGRSRKDKQQSPAPALQGSVAGVQINNGYYDTVAPVEPNTEEYGTINENVFRGALQDPLSTFSIDVDAASYSNVRRFIQNGQQVPKDAVRIEEMINYFDYDYTQPTGEDPFSIYTEVSAAPWNDQHKLVHIGLQGKKIPVDNLPASNLVFLIDVSGSMSDPNKLPLLQSSFKLLVEQLRKQDRVAIVVYAGAAGVVLPSTSGAEKQKIINALDNLQAGGSTAGGAGIQLAYAIAKENFQKDGNNRVILATDGDFNVGASSDQDMEHLIEQKRGDGIFLTVLGYGMGNYKDKKMEILADKGNGNYAYIDNMLEAQKTLVNEFGGTLFTIAKDVKLQIEFNPDKVQAYRLIGYENRMLQAEDFNNDKKDAGELGSGHTVTALYEIIPAGVKSAFYDIDKLKYQKPSGTTVSSNSNELMTVKFRYKKPDGNTSKLLQQVLLDKNVALENTSDDFRWSAAVAGFGMLLRESQYVKEFGFKDVLALAQGARGKDVEGYRGEFIGLIRNQNLMTRR
ncbi:von Willebrand factor type A domain-containing protein [Fulvivirgaceae bacterium PWU5]|uniref:von Willebrand factor type A domain-containing protein n=1 Tax=Dawidia cretensis TaxID=2782350 RepID=A0AAP2E332_9BACT|nr:von Willebrand factor type A domain-containing protein [Dawidia cretensis]MBT1712160.1 von Willebrand factor type A domain-containing protein [Dawidia cretensis]